MKCDRGRFSLVAFLFPWYNMDKKSRVIKMPRHARNQSASGVYHIMVRGNERKNIFLCDEDKERFLEVLQRMKENESYVLYAYCLMDNHIHLLIGERKDSVQRLMKRICVSYVYYFNKRYKRIGHLFQDRYRSEAVEDEAYILAAARYIHNNPVEAGIVGNAEDYKWSSYQHYINPQNEADRLVDRKQLFSMISDREEQAVQIFKNYSNETGEGIFIEADWETSAHREQIEGEDLKKQISSILEKHRQTLESFKNCRDKRQRNEIIKQIKEITMASIRELAKVLEISKDIIFRA
jgi:putative transposase